MAGRTHRAPATETHVSTQACLPPRSPAQGTRRQYKNFHCLEPERAGQSLGFRGVSSLFFTVRLIGAVITFRALPSLSHKDDPDGWEWRELWRNNKSVALKITPEYLNNSGQKAYIKHLTVTIYLQWNESLALKPLCFNRSEYPLIPTIITANSEELFVLACLS